MKKTLFLKLKKYELKARNMAFRRNKTFAKLAYLKQSLKFDEASDSDDNFNFEGK